MNIEDLSIKLAIPLGPTVLCDQNNYFLPKDLKGDYSCELGLIMMLTIVKT